LIQGEYSRCFFKLKINKVTDIDGNEYKTIKIGSQIWMQENLCATHYRNGEKIPYIANKFLWGETERGACSSYKKDDIVFFLYNWYAVSDIQGLAPKGWHVPTDKEWKLLEKYLGGRKAAGSKLKHSENNYWDSTKIDIDNSCGFNAIPFGLRVIGPGNIRDNFLGTMNSAYFWTASKRFNDAWCRELRNSFSAINRFYDTQKYGMSVRCIKD
jgi:uncharacterized protein (TIGR02145 family)